MRLVLKRIYALVFLLTIVAYLALLWFDAPEGLSPQDASKLEKALHGGFLLFLSVELVQAWRAKDRAGVSISDASPVFSGAFVVLATGLTATAVFAWRAEQTAGYALAGLVLLLTAAATVLVVRFARAHGDKIGEARFEAPQKDAEGD